MQDEMREALAKLLLHRVTAYHALGGNCLYYDDSFADLDQKAAAALSSPSAGAVRVKKLEWTPHPQRNLWRAFCLWGEYMVFAEARPSPSWRFAPYDGSRWPRGNCDTIEAAKATAQADFEARILSALESGE